MDNESTGVQIDAIAGGRAYGPVAARLLENGLSRNSLRVNTVLRADEWKAIDDVVLPAIRSRLVGVQDLIDGGLTKTLPDGLGTTVLQWETGSDMSDANIAIDANAPGDKDRKVYSPNYLPLPVIYKEFDLSARVLRASRNGSIPLDTDMAESAAYAVASKIESVLFAGAGTFTFGGGSLQGYLNYTNRNTGDLTANWDDTSGSIVTDVLAMKTALLADGYYGPFNLYIPSNFETALDEDYSTSTSVVTTIRDRIMQIGGIQSIKVADKCTADNVVMVSMNKPVVDIVIGLQPATFDWESRGGLMNHFIIMAIMVPRLKADIDGKCGIAHWS